LNIKIKTVSYEGNLIFIYQIGSNGFDDYDIYEVNTLLKLKEGIKQ